MLIDEMVPARAEASLRCVWYGDGNDVSTGGAHMREEKELCRASV
jgi:hypothetical protein